MVLEVEHLVGGFLSFGSGRDADATPKTGEIYGIYLLPELWGAGQGWALWDAATPMLRAQFSTAALWVLQNNPRARRFYERLGFEGDGHLKNSVIYGVEVPEVRYRKSL